MHNDLIWRAQPRRVVVSSLDRREPIAAGAPVFDLVDLDRLYLKAYPGKPDRHRVRLGQPAYRHVDAFPDCCALPPG